MKPRIYAIRPTASFRVLGWHGLATTMSSVSSSRSSHSRRYLQAPDIPFNPSQVLPDSPYTQLVTQTRLQVSPDQHTGLVLKGLTYGQPGGKEDSLSDYVLNSEVNV